MTSTDKSSEQFSKQQQERFLQAQRDFQRIQAEIAPFIRAKKITRVSTIGEWRDTSSLCD